MRESSVRDCVCRLWNSERLTDSFPYHQRSTRDCWCFTGSQSEAGKVASSGVLSRFSRTARTGKKCEVTVITIRLHAASVLKSLWSIHSTLIVFFSNRINIFWFCLSVKSSDHSHDGRRIFRKQMPLVSIYHTVPGPTLMRGDNGRRRRLLWFA